MNTEAKKAAHIVIDLETLDTAVCAVVLSIGAAALDEYGNLLADHFHAALFTEEQQWHRSTSSDTVKWWSEQSEEARKASGLELCGSSRRRRPDTALGLFGDWVHQVADPKTVCVWGKGPAFDNAILRSLYEDEHLTPPWHWRNDRCIRTAIELAPAAALDIPFEGIQHHALDDARHEAKQLSIALKHMRSTTIDVQPCHRACAGGCKGHCKTASQPSEAHA